MSTSSKVALIFDFDGTIANTLPVAIGILNRLAKTFGYDRINEDELEKLRSLSISDMRSYLKLSWLELPLFLFKLRSELFNQISFLKPVFGMEDVLAELKHRKITMGVITSNDEKVVKKFLDEHFPFYFDFYYFGTSLFGKDKALKTAMELHELRKEDVIYVGDEVRDIVAARRAEVKVASVTWGLQSEALLLQQSPDFIVRNANDLLKLV